MRALLLAALALFACSEPSAPIDDDGEDSTSSGPPFPELEPFSVTVRGHGTVRLFGTTIACAEPECLEEVLVDSDPVYIQIEPEFPAWGAYAVFVDGEIPPPVENYYQFVVDEPGPHSLVVVFAQLPPCIPDVSPPMPPLWNSVPREICAGKQASFGGTNLSGPGGQGSCFYFRDERCPVDIGGKAPGLTIDSEQSSESRVVLSVPAAYSPGLAYLVDTTTAGSAIASTVVVSGLPTPQIDSVSRHSDGEAQLLTVAGANLDHALWVTLTCVGNCEIAPGEFLESINFYVAEPAATEVTVTLSELEPVSFSVSVSNACETSNSVPLGG